MSSARFTLGGTILTFPAGPLPATESWEFLQTETHATGGSRFVQDLLAEEKLLPLVWPRMTIAKYTALLDFFVSTAKGMSGQFTYTDVKGTAVTVSFATPEIRAREIGYDSMEVFALLEVV